MTTEHIALAGTSLIAIAAIITAVVTALRGRSEATKGEREMAVDERKAVVIERSQAIAEAETTTGLLREQIDILRQHRDEREAEIKTEREEWHEREKKTEAQTREREKKLEARVLAVEEQQRESAAAYATLVLTITTMKYCAQADTCGLYDPGDRRTKRASKTVVKAGVTD